jgi:hypothetical protein
MEQGLTVGSCEPDELPPLTAAAVCVGNPFMEFELFSLLFVVSSESDSIVVNGSFSFTGFDAISNSWRSKDVVMASLVAVPPPEDFDEPPDISR